ncbi:rhodanese-like domain-containing protein [Pseudonocardia alni]|jgi:phage shock protein E|uniref:Rhodanese-related sulfurtransferase n=1 Tax=Pseudonocardia alni TaxID=33907 RepID=A0A852WIW4_PSEA5|nr:MULTISPECIES: rhodanese-like domain-containing protein [Pseudonocardia]MCO7191659.1 rhodanese-like domain-containing protein [Pseudonocardia sp. McavD-2-B]NYG05496.1 rhodanese-related sulfurtransferase [Pseudonocardia antarctica]WFG47387.1 rhodanese-like domain-containing protein [Pseudonocardia alni]
MTCRPGLGLVRPATIALAALVLLAACASTPTAREAAAPSAATVSTGAAASPVRLVDAAQFAELVDRDGVVVVNVHTPDDGSIAGTDASIPFDQIGERVAELPADRAAALAVYCRTGTMSAAAATTLAKLGYRNLTDLAGGMQAWQDAGHPLLAAGS